MFANSPDGLKSIIHKQKSAYVRLGKGRLGQDMYIQYTYFFKYLFHQAKVCILLV